LSKTTCARRPAVSCECQFALAAPRHHDLLLNVEADVATTLELMELATTWDEIDYSGEAVIPPCDWMGFAAVHQWRNPELAFRLFSLATDVAARRPEPAMARR
jgi:hypothetical protein